MPAFFYKLFDTSGFPPRWYCGATWFAEPAVGWMHIVSDVAIFAAYTAIPLMLVYFIYRKKTGVSRSFPDRFAALARRSFGPRFKLTAAAARRQSAAF